MELKELIKALGVMDLSVRGGHGRRGWVGGWGADACRSLTWDLLLVAVVVGTLASSHHPTVCQVLMGNLLILDRDSDTDSAKSVSEKTDWALQSRALGRQELEPGPPESVTAEGSAWRGLRIHTM